MSSWAMQLWLTLSQDYGLQRQILTGSKFQAKHMAESEYMDIQVCWCPDGMLLISFPWQGSHSPLLPLEGQVLKRISQESLWLSFIKSLYYPRPDLWKTHLVSLHMCWYLHIWFSASQCLQMLTSKPPGSPCVRLAILISILWKEQLRNDGTSSKFLLVGRPDMRKLIISAQTTQMYHSLAYQKVP